MSVIRIVFLGTPDFAVASLEALKGDSHFEVVRVYTQPDKPSGRHLQMHPTPVKAKALELGIDVKNVEDINAPEVIEELKSLNVDSAVVVAFGQILKEPFLKLFPHPAVNVHSSLLPRWRGAAPMQRAILADDKETGVSLQVIVKALDAGPVIGERRISLTDDIDILKLYDRLKIMAGELLKVEFMDYIRGSLTPRTQNPDGVTIAKKIKKEEGLIDWSKPSRTIFNQIRALKGWPGTWTIRDGKQLKILEAHISATNLGQSKPGTIINIETDGITLACLDGCLKVTKLQPESRAAVRADEFVRGHHIKVGESWG